MKHKLIKVLLVEDNPGDARLLKEYLSESKHALFDLIHVERLTNALERIDKEHFDIVLLDLVLPDSQGYPTFSRMYAQAINTPIVVLSGLNNESLAIKAVQEGAQDYLVKGEVDAVFLSRSLHYAIERYRMQMALRSQSLIDDLTGLYNRRGFLTLGEKQLKLSRRTKRGFFLVFIDLDGLKHINDSFGHLEGDKALIKTAEILKKTFRETDIIARIGGDEFTILAIDASGDNDEIINKRLGDNINHLNLQDQSLYKLSLSAGIIYHDAKSPSKLEDLMEKADEELYKQKRYKKGF